MAALFTSMLPLLLPAIISMIGYFLKKKMLSDDQAQSFIDFVQAMSAGTNFSRSAHDKFRAMHEKLNQIHIDNTKKIDQVVPPSDH